TAGLGRLDSWSTDGHKLLNVSYDCGIAICANASAHRAAMSVQAAYLEQGEGGRDPMDWGPDFSRRARGVGVNATLRALGRDGVAGLLVLGILDPDYFLGGRSKLRRDLADKALAERIGEPLRLSVEEAAMAVFAIQNGQTADLVRKIVLDAGQDPRDFTVYAFGGAGPIHCHAYSADLGIGRVVVPLGTTASAFSAFGLASSDVTLTFELSDPTVAPVEPKRVAENFARLEARAHAELARQGVEFERVEVRREIDARYTAQMAEVATPVAAGGFDEEAVARIIDAFEDRYASIFGAGTGYRAAGVQFITYRVFAHGVLPFKPKLTERVPASGSDPRDALKGRRPVCLDARHGYVDTPVYDVARLAPGHVVEGPAVIEAPTTTVVVGQDSVGTVDRLGNVVLSGL
ncbi:hydantoinase/oxoprolinase family protein, partial [Amycolatopsis sp. NPDC047767]|uniref:hydantoinase/oxoprolinase family protein n=1 Tax=Amycolatopsis sp. NPDC047767 TaxID=3156765 RepID=UPI003451D271